MNSENFEPDNEDIAYLAGLTNAEIARMRADLSPLIEECRVSGVSPVLERFTEELGRLSARLVVLEEATELQLSRTSQNEAVASIEESVEQFDPCKTDMDIEYIVERGVFHDIETDSHGRRFAWTWGPSFSVRLAAQDEEYRYVQVFFVAIAQPSYARSLKVVVNGGQRQHIVYASDEQLCIEAKLPPFTDSQMVELTVSVPEVQSLSTNRERGADWREGGIAISRVALAKQSSAPILKRLFR